MAWLCQGMIYICTWHEISFCCDLMVNNPFWCWNRIPWRPSMVSGKTAPAGSGSLLLKRLPCRYPLREPWQLRIHDFNKEIIPSPLHSSLMYLQFRYLKWQLITVLGEWDWSILIYKVWEPLFAETLQKVKRPGPVPNAHLATPVDQHPHPYSCWLKASLCWWLSPCLRLFKPLFPAGPHAHFCFQVFPCLFL